MDKTEKAARTIFSKMAKRLLKWIRPIQLLLVLLRIQEGGGRGKEREGLFSVCCVSVVYFVCFVFCVFCVSVLCGAGGRREGG